MYQTITIQTAIMLEYTLSAARGRMWEAGRGPTEPLSHSVGDGGGGGSE